MWGGGEDEGGGDGAKGMLPPPHPPLKLLEEGEPVSSPVPSPMRLTFKRLLLLNH